ncbi:MAG TPA: hypothetical protein VIA62_22215 [Thermoanaerobaculia bacterium]|jgi:predicted exporter|nr:hypothetical protein [Thermoanaerobaculia bacterium]
MARERRNAGILGDLQRLSATLEANKDQLPQVEPFRLRLEGVVSQALEAGKQQAALKASKQESSKQFRQFLTQGQALANVIRTVVKEHFGAREEKVAEFGLPVFRGRKVKPAAETPHPTIPPAPAGGAAPPAKPGG